MRSITAGHLLAILSIVLAGCTGAPSLNGSLNAKDLAGCNQLSDMPDDRDLADPAQMKLIKQGKEHYRRGEYGLAENAFRKATEDKAFGAASMSRVATLEGWYGLAASYDQLRRFDLADPVYAHIRKTYGDSVTYYNNYGYSLELRGDEAGARAEYEKAMRMSPNCQITRNNLQTLDTK